MKIEIFELENLDAAFGNIGLRVGPRTGPNKRTKEDEEWWTIRKFLKSTLPQRFIKLPISIRKEDPSKPDFALSIDGIETFVEITQATNEKDQREMSRFEKSSRDFMMLGDFGGRYAGGAANPKCDYVKDVLRAIYRKRGKIIYSNLKIARHLIIYPNSNASLLLSDEDEELDAFAALRSEMALQKIHLKQLTNGCGIHVLGRDFVCFDLLGSTKICKANYSCTQRVGPSSPS